MPPYVTRRRNRPIKVLSILLAVVLLAMTAALVQTRSRTAQVTDGSPSEAEATDPGRSSEAAALEAGAGTGFAAPFLAGGSDPSAPSSEGFTRIARPGEDYTSAYVIERGSGRVFYQYNANAPVPTASMAKMMTCLIVMEEIEAGRLRLDDPVTISARASLMGGSQIYARQGQVFPVQTLLAATMIQSANDGATALAEKVAGNVESFAELMNRRAQALGLESSRFYDPHGLPSRAGQDDVMSARDLAVLGNELMRYPLMQEYAAAATFPFENATFTAGMTNPNRLLTRYDGAYGIKTGYTAAAGFSVTAGARRGDMDVIAVVTGAKQSRGPVSSFEIAGRMMDQAFLDWSVTVPLRQGDPAGEVQVSGGDPARVQALAAADAKALIPRGEDARVAWSLEPTRVSAPLAKGDTVGTIVLRAGDQEVGRVPAVTAQAVGKRPWWKVW